MIFKKYSDIQITTRREIFLKSFSGGTNDIACDHLFLQGHSFLFPVVNDYPPGDALCVRLS